MEVKKNFPQLIRTTRFRNIHIFWLSVRMIRKNLDLFSIKQILDEALQQEAGFFGEF